MLPSRLQTLCFNLVYLWSSPTIQMGFQFLKADIIYSKIIKNCPISIYLIRLQLLLTFFLFSFLLPPRRIVFQKPYMHIFTVTKSSMGGESYTGLLWERFERYWASGSLWEDMMNFFQGKQSILSSLPPALSAFIHVHCVLQLLHKGSFFSVMWLPDRRHEHLDGF